MICGFSSASPIFAISWLNVEGLTTCPSAKLMSKVAR